jgi:glycosyltransferase involved in cell wall biosynthesis
MIVKDEEAVLKRCLDTVADLVDEIIIVDTGSTDATKEIALTYTGLVFDFEWIDDFAAARNFAFSKATKEYIYSADADEVIDAENHEHFLQMKESLSKDIEIVQMRYGNQLQFGTVYNFDEELRPKLFKRQREFVWQEPVHEMVRLEPMVLDSDILITHMPISEHGSRDLRIFEKQIALSRELSKRLRNMYAKELYITGSIENFERALPLFESIVKDTTKSEDEIKEASCIVARATRLLKDDLRFYKYALKVVAVDGCSEICFELGSYYEEKQDWEEAIVWYYNAAYETQPLLSIETSTNYPWRGIARCYHALGNLEMAAEFEKLVEENKQ